jgi:hypothetical protein
MKNYLSIGVAAVSLLIGLPAKARYNNDLVKVKLLGYQPNLEASLGY